MHSFQANQQYDSAKDVLYQDFPSHFTWKAKEMVWTPRRRGYAIGRIYNCGTRAGDRFYLRLLLTHVKGPQSQQHLQTVNGVQHPTCKAACVALGLLEDDGEWRQCLTEACQVQVGPSVRRLFAVILAYNAPTHPKELWLQFNRQMCDDLLRWRRYPLRQTSTDEEVLDYGLYLIQQHLARENINLHDISPDMPQVMGEWQTIQHHQNIFIQRQLEFDSNKLQNILNTAVHGFNPEQCAAFDAITQAYQNPSQSQQLFFIHGPGGTGKTFVYNALTAKARLEGHIVLCVASSGIASQLLLNGSTAHSMFKIPIPCHEDSTCGVKKQSPLAALFCAARMIVWDEVSMSHRNVFQAVDRMLQDIRDSPLPFGGLTVVFGGDFQQTLPIIRNGSREQIVRACLTRSPIFHHTKLFFLTQNMRLANNQDPAVSQFAQFQLDLGSGKNLPADGNVKIPNDLCLHGTTIQPLIQHIYPSIHSNPPPQPEYFINRMLLAPRNEDVHVINHNIIDMFQASPTQTRVYQSADSAIIRERESDDIPVEFLNEINISGLPVSKLTLKVGCPIMLLSNLSTREGLCNGTRGIVAVLKRWVIGVHVIHGGILDTEITWIPRLSLEPSEEAEFHFTLRRCQFPIALAFAMTINKSQGQTVAHVGIDLRMSCFSHGQLYVGCSRTTTRQGLKLLLPPPDTQGTTNVVWHDALLTPM